MTDWSNKLRDAAAGIGPALVDFCRRLIQAPSETGQEGVAADVYRTELEKLGFASVTVDAFGNVCGHVPNVVARGNLLFCGHLDQVGAEAHFPGSEGEWPYDPFDGQIADGYLWGRGASDVKGSLAAQVYGAHLLKLLGAKGSGDLIVGGVGHDEAAFPAGIKYLCETTFPKLGWTVDAAVAGPATGLDVALGHMGKVELDLIVNGISRHISRRNEAVNPIFEARTLLDILERLDAELPISESLGKEIMAPTMIRTTSKHSAHIPAACVVTVNWRFLPGRTKDDVVHEIKQACSEAAKFNPRFNCIVEERTVNIHSYTGLDMTITASCAAFLIPKEHPYVKDVLDALQAVGQKPQLTTWPVPTHAGYLGGTLGIPTVGYSPCEYRYNHTPQDRVSVQALVDAAVGYAAIAHGAHEQ